MPYPPFAEIPAVVEIIKLDKVVLPDTVNNCEIVVLPSIFADPTICNLAFGVVVPIPVLPDASTTIL